MEKGRRIRQEGNNMAYALNLPGGDVLLAVSYTHLTLPTIAIV